MKFLNIISLKIYHSNNKLILEKLILKNHIYDFFLYDTIKNDLILKR